MAKAPAKQETREITPQQQLRGQMDKMGAEFLSVLPATMTVDRFKRVTTTAVVGTPELMNADRKSLFGACLQCASDGLLPDGREAALVVFGSQVAYMPMVRGIIKKVRGSGELRSIRSHIVCANDRFSYVLGDQEKIIHEPAWAERGEVLGCYAIAELKGDVIEREYMTVTEIEEVRAVSKAKNSGPWVTWWGEMAKKTVIRRLSKRLPMTTDLDQLFDRDNHMYREIGETLSADAPPAPLRQAQPPVAAVTDQREPLPGDDGPNGSEMAAKPGAGKAPADDGKAKGKAKPAAAKKQTQAKPAAAKPVPYQFVNWDGEVTERETADGVAVLMQDQLRKAPGDGEVQGVMEANAALVNLLAEDSDAAELIVAIEEARDDRLAELKAQAAAERADEAAAPEAQPDQATGLSQPWGELYNATMAMIDGAQTPKALDSGWAAAFPELMSSDMPDEYMAKCRGAYRDKREQLATAEGSLV